jgi:glutamine amidotransferase
MIVVIDVGLGNIGSLLNMLKYLGVEARASASADDVRAATRLLLPGVGAFDSGMRRLEESGLVPVLRRRVLEEKIPLLGICLGMQLLGRSSEEGERPGLGFLPARTLRFAFPPGAGALRVPHMGWNACEPVGADSLLQAVPAPRRFYFVHSYHVVCDEPDCVAGVTRYGIEFTAAVRRGNIHGVQFHAEKSHRYGMALLERFVRHD